MRQALRPNPQKRQVSKGVSIPAPVGGWNARDPVAAMPISDALILDNWIPRAGYVEMRRGTVEQTSGLSNPVLTLMPFRGLPTGDKLFAASGGAIYDVTSQGPVGSAIATGFTTDAWNYTNFAEPGQAWLVACNGQDAPQGYSTSWGAIPTLSGSSGPITLNPDNLFNVFAHQARLYYLEKGTLHVWNPAAATVGGACTLLDLSSIFNKGGRLIAGGSWSFQFGVTADDFAVFMTDQGQIAVYEGIDPTNASDWSLIGVYDFGPPMGSKSLIKFGGDLAVVTADGVMPLSQALKLERSQQNEVALTAKIINAFAAAVKNYSANAGWQGILYPGNTPSTDVSPSGGSLAIINVPVSPPPWSTDTTYPASSTAAPVLVLGSDGYIYSSAAGSNAANNPVTDGGAHWTKLSIATGTNLQFVQNVMTGAWCRFLNLDAFCWELANGCVYFGGTNGVFQWDVGSDDLGNPIIGDVKSAFTNFGDGSRQKRFTMIRPLLNTTSAITPALDIDVDYQESEPTAVPTVSPQGAGASIRYDWTGASGIGYVGAARMQVNLIGDTSTPTLGIGDTPPHDLAIDSSGDTLFTQTSEPFDVPCQLLGFDLIDEPGGQL